MWNVVILAGGGGTRLWPMSRRHFPKQFLTVFGRESFLQQSVRRALSLAKADQIMIVTNNLYQELVRKQLEEMEGSPRCTILCEPDCRSTAPAIALAASSFPEEERVYAVFPSDHYLTPIEPFQKAVVAGRKLAEEGYIVLFGIKPHTPHTGYGYIRVDRETQVSGALKADAFIEKPDLAQAEILLAEGKCFWNSGIFLFAKKTLRTEFETHCPEMAHALNGSFEHCLAEFPKLPSLSMDYAVMEKSDKLVVLPLDIAWSDIGSWESVYDFLDKDKHANSVKGPVAAFDSKGCLFMGQKRLIVANGIEDLAVIDMDDVLFISKLTQTQSVKEIVGKLQGHPLVN